MSYTVENRKQYNELLLDLESGNDVPDDVFEAMVSFAKAKKIKRPDRPAAKAAQKPEKKAAKAKAGKTPSSARAKNKGEKCIEDGCDRDAVAKKRCSRHHTAWWRAQDPKRMERAREASRRYAAKKRAEKAAK